MKSVVSRILPAIVIMLFVGFIAYIHLSGLRPSFSVLQENISQILKLEKCSILVVQAVEHVRNSIKF